MTTDGIRRKYTILISPDSEDKIRDLYQKESEIMRNRIHKFVTLLSERVILDDVRCKVSKASKSITCSLCIYPGANIAYDSDYTDDKELGTGRALWELLMKNRINHRVRVSCIISLEHRSTICLINGISTYLSRVITILLLVKQRKELHVLNNFDLRPQ